MLNPDPDPAITNRPYYKSILLGDWKTRYPGTWENVFKPFPSRFYSQLEQVLVVQHSGILGELILEQGEQGDTRGVNTGTGRTGGY